MWWTLFLALVLGTGLMRLIELIISVRRMRLKQGDVIAEPALFPLMALLHIGLIACPIAEVWLLERAPLLPLNLAALCAFGGASVLRVWTLRTIGRAWNVRVVAPDEGTIATGGPYRYIRHPNYLVVIIEILSLPLIHTAWLSALALSCLNAVVLWRRIHTEETMLRTIPDWERHMAHKARLIPGVF